MRPHPHPLPRNNNPSQLTPQPIAFALAALLLAAPLACGERSVLPAVDGGSADAATNDSTTNDSAANDSAPTGDFNPGPISCTSNQACSPTSYCYFTDCGKSGPGTCMPRPSGCTADCPGVCGCDGKTYCNSCGAAAVGVSTASKGPCKPPPPTSCSTNADCASSKEYCHIDGGCQVTGAKMGQCKPRPQNCPSTSDPVCGCDDKTYGNACAAHWAGTNVAYKGACNSCSKTKCVVVNDCCGCKAIDANVTKPKPCPAMCFQPQCDAAGIKKPTAYCKQGKCFLGDAKTGCSTDADCSLVNDCCSCAALPTSVQTPYCSLPSCYVPTCTALGFPKAKAVCGALGVCTLSL
jgi:hypothetical protein